MIYFHLFKCLWGTVAIGHVNSKDSLSYRSTGVFFIYLFIFGNFVFITFLVGLESTLLRNMNKTNLEGYHYFKFRMMKTIKLYL